MLQIPKYTFSRIIRQKQANGGIRWSDEGIARSTILWKLIGNCVETHLIKSCWKYTKDVVSEIKKEQSET